MTNIEIIKAYSAGEKSLEDANTELKKNGAGFSLNPMKHCFTPEEIIKGTAGLLDSGLGSFDKVKIDPVKMELIHGLGVGYGLVLLNGKTYEVHDKKLVEIR